MASLRTDLKRVLAHLTTGARPAGVTMLIYHRVGGPGHEELDVSPRDFAEQMSVVAQHGVTAIDEAITNMRRGDISHRVVLTLDDGFADIYANAWPLLRELGLPFTIYVASAYVGGEMRWEGSTAKDLGARALTWEQLGEMVDSGLCTIGNHTHHHVRPEALTEQELDRCSEVLRGQLGITPHHFAYPWGVPVPRMDSALRARFLSAATGEIGRNLPSTDAMRLKRVPVRRTDPLEFFRAKLTGNLVPERVYGGVVSAAKKVGAHA